MGNVWALRDSNPGPTDYEYASFTMIEALKIRILSNFLCISKHSVYNIKLFSINLLILTFDNVLNKLKYKE